MPSRDEIDPKALAERVAKQRAYVERADASAGGLWLSNDESRLIEAALRAPSAEAMRESALRLARDASDDSAARYQEAVDRRDPCAYALSFEAMALRNLYVAIRALPLTPEVES